MKLTYNFFFRLNERSTEKIIGKEADLTNLDSFHRRLLHQTVRIVIVIKKIVVIFFLMVKKLLDEIIEERKESEDQG